MVESGVRVGHDPTLTFRQKREKAIRRSRDNKLKSQDEKRLNEIIKDNAIAIKHLQLQKSLLLRRKKRLDVEKAWSNRLFDGGDIARACRRVSTSKDAIKEINLRNVGSIVFEAGGFTPSDSTPDSQQALHLLGEVRNYKIRAQAAGARQVTVMNYGKTIGGGTNFDKSRISLDSYLYRDRADIKNEQDTKSRKSLSEKSTSTFLPHLSHSKLTSTSSSTDTTIASRGALKASPSLDKSSVISSLSLKSVNKVKPGMKKGKEPTGAGPSHLYELLTQGPGFSNRDALLIEEYVNDSGNGGDNAGDEETVIRLQRIIDTWKIKHRKLKRMRRTGDEDTDPTRYFDNEDDWRFILHVLHHLRGRDSQNALTPLAALQCRYLRLSDVNISQLEKACRALGQEPGIHAFSKPSKYDPYVNNIFENLSSTPVPPREKSVATVSQQQPILQNL